MLLDKETWEESYKGYEGMSHTDIQGKNSTNRKQRKSIDPEMRHDWPFHSGSELRKILRQVQFLYHNKDFRF